MLRLPSLLLVDGDSEHAVRLAAQLERVGLHTTLAADGSHACDELEAAPFDLVLAELDLPDMSALGLLRCLRRARIEVPFVATGGTPDVEDIVQLMRHGAIDYLARPLSVEAVEAALERAVQHVRRANERRPPPPPPGPAPRSPAPPLGSDPAASAESRGLDPRPPSPTPPDPEPPAERWSSPPSERPPPAPPASGSAIPPFPRASRKDVVPSQPLPSRPLAAARRATSGRPGSSSTRKEDAPSESALQRIARQLRGGDIQLPAIAPIAGQVQQLMSRAECEVDEIVALLGSDPSVTMGVLRLANSGRFGTSRPVTDLHEAVVRVGNKRALSLGHQVLLSTLYTIDAPPLAGMMAAMWRNTVVTANGTRELAHLLGLEDAESEFVSGTLHNVGELALVRILDEMPERLEPGEFGLRAVAQVLEAAHEDFGRALLKRWAMPPRFVRVAGAHHHAPGGPEDRVALRRRNLVLLGWSMAIERGFRYLPEQKPADILQLCEDLGLDVADVEAAYADANEW